MRIHVLLPMMHKTGGVLVALRYADYWGQCGHDVHVYYPLFLSHYHIRHSNPILKALSYLRYGWRNFHQYRKYLIEGWPTWVKGAFQVHLAHCQSTQFLPEAEATIATAWTTAFWAAKSPQKTGRLFYFIQGYEVWNGREELVHGSYRLGMHNVVIAPWLEEVVRKFSPNQPITMIPNGVDTAKFFAPDASLRRSGFLAMFHENPIKGGKTAIQIFQMVHEYDSRIPLVMFGVEERPQILPSFIEYVQNPLPAKLVELYQQAAFYLSAGSSEGWGLTIMEALACGCVVYSPLTGCVPLVNEKQPIIQVFEVDKLQVMLDQFKKLVQNSSQVSLLSQQGSELARTFSWEVSEFKFLQLIENGHVSKNV